MRVRGTARDQDDGFTLLELLVALAILSGIATIMLGAMVSVRQMTRHFIARETDDSSVATAQTILRSRIASLRALPRSGRTTAVVDLTGDERQFSFQAPPLGRDAPGSLQAFRLLRMATGDLVLFSSPVLTENVDLHAPSIAGWTPNKLLTGVDELSISYFGPAPNASGGRWQRFWSERTQAPELVRIGVRFGSGDRRVWPDLIISPAVTTNMACQFDPVTARCRDTASR